jgi:[acyl-carrier-protein] S-malonyltransferase
MTNQKKIAFIFPGQGAQYPGMAKDFFENFALAKETFEEADDLLHRNLSKIIFEGPEAVLTETKNSQTAIFVVSIAILNVIKKSYPHLIPTVCSGLSLGEYTALTASNRLDFATCLPLVQHRGQYMNEACEAHPGTMAVVLGLDAKAVEDIVKEVNLPNDLWAANFNCPGQIVISGTSKGIEVGSAAAKAKGAKRVLPLQVHGAFHSGLMKSAEVKLQDHVHAVNLKESQIEFVMNVPGDYVEDKAQIKTNLINQVTHSVRWEQGIRRMADQGIDLFIEIGCGKTLAGFNKRILPEAKTISVEKITDLDQLLNV